MQYDSMSFDFVFGLKTIDYEYTHLYTIQYYYTSTKIKPLRRRFCSTTSIIFINTTTSIHNTLYTYYVWSYMVEYKIIYIKVKENKKVYIMFTFKN